MPLVDRLYEWLEVDPSGEADLILSAGLEQAEPPYAERIERILLRRGSTRALAGLIQHWCTLSETTRESLLEHPEQIHQSLEAVLRSGSAEARLNALHAFEQLLPARLAYLLPAAILDPVPRIRNAATEVLYKTAAAFLQRSTAAPGGNDMAAVEYAAERRALVKAVREAVRSFDLHRRPEALELGTWFSRELDGALWEQLDNPRSRARSVVAELLPTWNRPWMAGFLLEALTRNDWRVAALKRLSQWETRDELLALLRESDALDDPEIARRLAAIRNPAWFRDVDTCLKSLPDELRRHVPRWIRWLGLGEQAKLRALLACFQTGEEPVQRAALYALAALHRPESAEFFRRMAGLGSPLATFAAWFLAGLAARNGSEDAPADRPTGATQAHGPATRDTGTTFAGAATLPGMLLTENLIDQYRRLSEGFNQAPTSAETWTFLLVIAGGLIVILLLAHFIGRRNRSKPPPKVDYLTVAVDLLGLSELERADLRRLAHACKLDPAAAMLLSPANLAWAVQHALGHDGAPERRKRLEQLCVKLFDVPLPETPCLQRPDKTCGSPALQTPRRPP
jgi:hypothetical protein